MKVNSESKHVAACGGVQANGTFEELERLQNVARAWEELGPQLWTFFHSSVQMNMLRVRRGGPHAAQPHTHTHTHIHTT